jgi:hypothetical protein
VPAPSKTLRKNLASAIAAAVFVLLSRPVLAEEAPPTRELPDYAGREDRTSAGEVLLWVPRIALSPLYLVSEFGIRRPLGALISLAERNQVPEVLFDFFTFTPDHKVGVVPTFFVDFGFKPSVGFYFFWDDVIASGNDLRVNAATWGPEWLSAGVTDRLELSDMHTLELALSAVRRADYRFYGEGPSSREQDVSRYGASHLTAELSLLSQLTAAVQLRASAGLRNVSFHEPSGPYTPTAEQIEAGVFPEPERFGAGYTAQFSSLKLQLDTRGPRARSGSGLHVEAGIEQGSTLAGGPRNWLEWGGSLRGDLDLNSRGRVLALALTALFSDPLTRRDQPFTELVQLGGSGPMPGFLPGRLYGRSAAVATLSYHWPIWVWLNGSLQASVGNVFDAHLQDFSASLLRFSSAIGIETAGVSDNPVQILFGLGTETFASGAAVESFRLVFGTTHEYF